VKMMMQVLKNIGAGEGNRTLVISLEGCCSTIELHPQSEIRGQMPEVGNIVSFLCSLTSVLCPLVGEVGLEPTKA
jgi:hypothetical protein